MTFEDDYARAVRTSNMRSRPTTTRSHSDIIGAAGLAAKNAPLALALARLFVGDNRAAYEIVELLAGMLVGKAWHSEQVKLSSQEASEIARAVLAWHRDGTCKPCGGHGLMRREDSPTFSGVRCRQCRGSGRIRFDRQFPLERLLLARWLLAEVEREQAVAGPAAMRALAPSFESI